MTWDAGIIGNGELLAKVRADGAMTEAFYPSIGYFRHLLQSQFALFDYASGELLWLASGAFQPEQRYLEHTNVLQTSFAGHGLRARVIDFVHPETNGVVRTLEVRNEGAEPRSLGLFHAEASSVADHRGEFGYNVVYYNRLRSHMVRYRGHPWDSSVEAQIAWLICPLVEPDSFQCGVSYQDDGPGRDAFVDLRDGALEENRYAFGDPTGVTSAFLWRRTIQPGESVAVSVLFAAGMSLFEAEDTAHGLRERKPARLLGETVTYWKEWISRGERTLPALNDARLEKLYLRSILLLKLLQDRRFGSFIAAPTLDPDYRYCWPRDGVYEAWALDLCGYHEEARHFYRWCQRTQMNDGVWYQNHYTDGRRHWTGIQVDQVGSILWGAWEHYQLTKDRSFLVDMWGTLQRGAEYVLSRVGTEEKLVYSEQDLWEESGGFITYTNAACAAGLAAAAKAAREVGQESSAARWDAAAESLAAEIEVQLKRDGCYIGELDPCHRFPVRADYVLDISILGLSTPYEILHADSPAMVRTVQRIMTEVDYPIEGVGRYGSDLFMGGNPWSLSALWLALYFADTGQVQEVWRQVNWCLKHATVHDFMPEQSHKHTGQPAGATPLGWSHAWLIVLFQKLGRLLEETGDEWRTDASA